MNLPLDIQQFYLEYIVAIMALFIFYLLYFVLTKDTQTHKNIHSLATALEDINKELFYLKKQINEIDKELKSIPQRMNDDEIYQEIERAIYDMTQPLKTQIDEIQNSIDTIDIRVDSRMASLESGVKQISIPSALHAKDDEKILQLFNEGLSAEQIAKDLNLPHAEVKFTLKMKNMK